MVGGVAFEERQIQKNLMVNRDNQNAKISSKSLKKNLITDVACIFYYFVALYQNYKIKKILLKKSGQVKSYEEIFFLHIGKN